MRSVFALLFLLLYGMAGRSFTLNSSTNPNLKGWSSSNIKIYLNPTNCPSNVDVGSLISDAASIWNNLPNSSINISYGGTTANSGGMSDPPVAYCLTNFQSIADIDSVPGAASVDGSSGSITAGIIYLNASAGLANIGNFDRDILKIILAHEIGHLGGLGHSSSTNALMYFDASYKQQFRLSQDDMDGMAYLYPRSDLNVNSLAGCGLITKLPPPNGSEKWILLMVMLFPFELALILKSARNRAS